MSEISRANRRFSFSFDLWVREQMDLQDDLAGAPRRTKYVDQTVIINLSPAEYHARIALRNSGQFPHYEEVKRD